MASFFLCESDIFNGPHCKVQCDNCKGKKRMVKSKTKVLSDAMVLDILNSTLHAMSIADDNEVIVKYKKVPEGIEVSIVKEN